MALTAPSLQLTARNSLSLAANPALLTVQSQLSFAKNLLSVVNLKKYQIQMEGEGIRGSKKLQTRGMGGRGRGDKDTGGSSQGSAKWNEYAHQIFVKLCVDEVRKGNRDGNHFNKVGWNYLLSNFNTETNRNYNLKQIKNHWTQMRGDWSLWQQLMYKETGLGWDEAKQNVSAPDEWWENKIKMNKEFAKFHKKNCSMYNNEYYELFASLVATGEGAHAPSQGFAPPLVSTQRSGVGYDDYFDVDIEGDAYGGGIGGEGSGDSDDLVIGDNGGEGSGVREVFSGSSKRPSNENLSNEKKKKKVTSREHLSSQIDSMINIMQNRSATTMQYPVQESSVPSSTACIKLLSELPNVRPNTPFWNSACIIFMSKDAREIFAAQPDIESRLSLIKSLVDMKNSKMPPPS